MALMAVRKLELCQRIDALHGLEVYEGVRLYCYIHGNCIGCFDIWHSGHPISRERLIHEIGIHLWEELARRVFTPPHASPHNYWPHIIQMVADNLELALEPDDVVPVLTTPGLPAAVPPLMASITIPTRDRPEDLMLCLESLTRHVTEVKHEIIIVDNNPASGLTEPVVRQFPGVVYIPEPRAGVTYARNAGALHAQGDIIICSDDDVVVEDGWLDNLIRPFADPKIMAVSGMVIPYRLDEAAELLFEEYGGLTRSFEPTYFGPDFYYRKTLASDIFTVGVTANSAFRASVFADPAIGPFDNGLEIAEDPYMFYRILKAGGLCYYEPAAVVRHRHRNTRAGLRRQLYNYGRSFSSMMLRMWYVDGDRRALRALKGIASYQKQRLRNTLLGKNTFPLDLIWQETWGNIVGPFTLLKTIRQARRKGIYTADMFKKMQAAWQEETQAVEAETPPRPVVRRAPANPNYTQFIVLAQARTGSNLLQFLLASHKNVFLAHEIFNHREDVRKAIHNIPTILQLDDDPIEYVESCIYANHKKHIKAAGFKLLYYQAHNDEWKEIWEYLRSPHIKVIHLKRRNLLDRYLSFKLAMRSDVWIAFKNKENGASKDKGPIILEPDECFNDFRNSLNQQKELDELFKDQPKLDVIYEDLRANIPDESRRVQEFLGLKFQDLAPRTKKQQTKKKSEVIANYEELRAELTQALSSGDQWAREEWLEFFDD